MDSASEVGDSTVILHRSCAASHRKVSHQGYSRIPEDRSADGLRAHRLAGAILDTRQFLNVKDTIKQYGSLCRCGYLMCEQFFNCESSYFIFDSCILQNVRERVQERR